MQLCQLHPLPSPERSARWQGIRSCGRQWWTCEGEDYVSRHYGLRRCCRASTYLLRPGWRRAGIQVVADISLLSGLDPDTSGQVQRAQEEAEDDLYLLARGYFDLKVRCCCFALSMLLQMHVGTHRA